MSQRGIALIIVLWVSVILSGIVIAGAYVARLEMRQAYAHLREIQLVGIAKAGVEEARAKLGRDTDTVDCLADDWNRCDEESFGPVTLTVAVTDEESKINLNASSRDTLVRLPPVAGAANRDEIADSIIDWRDADGATRQNGGEEEYYQQRGSSSHCKNRFLDTLDELNLVKGCGGALATALKPAATVDSCGKVNVNTASADVLAALPGMNASLAAAVIARRSGADGIDGTTDDAPFSSVNEVKETVGNDAYAQLSSCIGVRSWNFKVRAVARDGKYTKIVEALLSRGAERVRLRYWRELF